MRTYTHVIDTMAIKKTLNAIPNYWVVREMTERDYGIDLMVEIFEPAGEDKHKNPLYDSTGQVCYLQIKGTNNKLTINEENETVSVSIPKKTLLYVEKFATPFLLVRVPTYEDNPTIYFTWMQRYILDRLSEDYPDWRTMNQETFTVYVPLNNTLPDKTKKVEQIAARIKYIEEFSLFYEKYTVMETFYSRMISNTFSADDYDEFIKNLRLFTQFDALLKYNNCQLVRDDILELIDFINDVKVGAINPRSEEEFPDPTLFNLNLLLSDNFMRSDMEEFIAENDGDTVY